MEPRASSILDKYFTPSYTPSLASEFLLKPSNLRVWNHLEGWGSTLEVLVERVCTRTQDSAFLQIPRYCCCDWSGTILESYHFPDVVQSVLCLSSIHKALGSIHYHTRWT